MTEDLSTEDLVTEVLEAMRTTQADINTANEDLKRFPDYAEGHPLLSRASGVLNTPIADVVTWQGTQTTPPASTPPVTTPPVLTLPATFDAAVVTDTVARVSWANVVPTELARNGSDSTGGGAWNTGPLTNQPNAGSFTFTLLVPGDTYEFTLTEASGKTLAASVKMPAATTTPPVNTPPVTIPPVGTPPVTTPPVTSPPAGTTPVPGVAAFASYVPAPGGIFDFAAMPTTAPGVVPAGWALSPESQISGPSIATDVQVINGKGLVLTMSDPTHGGGGSIETNPSLVKGGLALKGKIYRETRVILPALVSWNGQMVPPNQVGIWSLTEDNNGEIDDYITGWGNSSPNLETGNQSQYASHGKPYMVNGAYPTGEHVFGEFWDDTTADGPTYYLDEAAWATVPWPSGHAPDTTSPWWMCLTNQGTAGINGADGPMVTGEAGEVVVVSDYFFVPAAA